MVGLPSFGLKPQFQTYKWMAVITMIIQGYRITLPENFCEHDFQPTLVGNSSAFNEHKYLCVIDIIKKLFPFSG